MTPPDRARSVVIWTLHVTVFAVITLVLATARSEGTQMHAMLGYLLVILSASALAGRMLGLTLAVVGSFAIDFVFQTPHGRLGPDRVLDLLVVLAFLAVAGVTTQLLTVARERAAEAEARAREVAALASEQVRLVTEAEHARAEAEAARLRTQVLGGLSHDLRTPITTIRALAQEAERAGHAHGHAIDEQAARLQLHVQNLLDLARMRTHSFAITPELNTAEDLIGAVVRQVRGALGGRRITVRIDTTGAPALGTFDFTQTLRAIGNIVDNALRVSPVDGAVEIGAEQQRDGRLRLWVADRGPGIGAEDAAQVFDAWYSASDGPYDAARAGLGLAVAHELITQQDGTIGHVPREGGGTVFEVVLPGGAAS